jgi:hypothetical protein
MINSASSGDTYEFSISISNMVYAAFPQIIFDVAYFTSNYVNNADIYIWRNIFSSNGLAQVNSIGFSTHNMGVISTQHDH